MDNTSGIQAASQEAPRPARLNPFAFPSDTSLRFILLILCVLGASLWIYHSPFLQRTSDFVKSIDAQYQCIKGSNLEKTFPEIASRSPQGYTDLEAAQSANQRCMAPFYLQDVIHMLVGVILLLSVAGAIYLTFPAWKRRRKRLVPLPPEDLPEVMAELTALCREAGLKRQPQFLWNPLNPVSEGLAFGRMGRYAVALTGGLVKQAYDNPPAFRAVIRHELAHLRNGDIDKTYFSVAIWWAFVITALVPFVAYVIPHSISGLFADLTFSLDASLRVLALTALVLLLRNAVLRARELYADGRALTWDGPAGALDHVLERLPQIRHGRRWKIMQITQTHPEPWTRRAMLHDSWPLLQIGFWDALGAGIAAAIAFTGLDQLFSSLAGSLQISNLPGVLAGLVFGGLAAGVVGSGLWRATCASLMQGKTPRSVGLIALGMMSGIIIGQSLSLSSIGDNLLSFNTLGSSLVGWTAWGLILLLSLSLILRWLVTAATMWLQVTTTTSMLLWSSRVGLVIAGGFWAVCFGTLIFMYSLLSASTAFSSVSLLIEFLLVIVTLLLQPFFVIGLLGLWAFPFAARFWRRRAIATAGAGWAWLEPTPGQATPSDREPFQFRLALLVGIAGALLFCGLMLALRLWLRLTVPESVREMATFKLALADWIFSRAAVIQGGIAIVTAAWARRSGVLLALFAAFIGGCVMTIGTLVGALIYCGLILGMVISLRFITLKPVTSNLFTSVETTLLVVFQVVVGAIAAARSPRRGWLYGLFAAGITGFVGGSITGPLATTSAITSFAQSSAIILAGAFIAITGMLFALPVVLAVLFAARWVRRSRLSKNAGTPAATTTPTSSTL